MLMAGVVFDVVVIVEVADGFGDMVALVAYRQLWEVAPPGCEARARVSAARRSLPESPCQ